MSPQSTITDSSPNEPLSLAVSFYEANSTPERGIPERRERTTQRPSIHAVASSHRVLYSALRRWLARKEGDCGNAHQSQ